jgi:hypothetical protein
MPTARKPCPTCSDPKLWTLVEAVRPALVARAADRDPHIAYGRLVAAAVDYWPELREQLRQPPHVPQDVVVPRRRAENADATAPLPPVRF